MQVKAKKHLGQHFLTDKGIATKIAETLQKCPNIDAILEIGPGMGVLSTPLLATYPEKPVFLMDIDTESIVYLKAHFKAQEDKIIEADFLKTDFTVLHPGQWAIIGNFPYNISSQIVFKALEHRARVSIFSGMFQKEVAMRICAPPGGKEYGILSVLAQAYYHTDYLFTVKAGSFNPPPKVLSGVLRMVRKDNFKLECNEEKFHLAIKTGFNQRRKTLRNALKPLLPAGFTHEYLELRAEALSVEMWVELTRLMF